MIQQNIIKSKKMTSSEKKTKSIRIYKTDYIVESINDEALTEKKYLYQFEKYDEQGNLVLEASYTMNGDIQEKMERKYNNDSKLIEEMCYLTDDEIVERKEIVYDETGKIIAENIFFEEGGSNKMQYCYENQELVKKEFISEGEIEEYYSYEKQGNEKITKYFQEDELVYTIRQTEDENGNIIRLERMEDLENLVEEYSYDAKGKRTAMQQSVNGILLNKREFTYDESGEIIKILENNEGLQTETSIEYDNKNNAVLQLETDDNNHILTQIERVFDNNNKVIKAVVIIDDVHRGLSSKYTLEYEYEFYN
jgi:hypothetical protein